VSNPAKRKGSSFELDVCRYLGELFPAERIPAGGSLDRGDLWTPTVDAVWQCKNRQTLSLGAWWDDTLVQKANAGRDLAWLVVKRKGTTNPAQQFAITSLAQARSISYELTRP